MPTLVRAALVVGLIAGCSPPPATINPPSTQGGPTTPPASAGSGAAIAWEPYLRLGGMVDMVHGSGGWVALGECERGSCTTTATVWHSPDLEAWETIALPQSGDIQPISLAVNSEGYFLAAYDYDDVGGHDDAFLQVWRSSDGRLWERFGELRLGSCSGNDCPRVRGVGRAESRAIVVGAVVPEGDDAGQAYVSHDGENWSEMTIATFSNGVELDRIVVHEVEQTPADLFLVGEACSDTCALTVWSTTDGEHWAEEQSFGSDADDLSIAADGGQRVVAVTTCSTSSDCTTDVWTGVRSTAWTNVLPDLDLADPEVVWTDNVFVLIGVRDERFAAYVSADGLSWSEVPGDALGARGTCGDTWLAGGAGTVMFGVPGCALLQGTVQQAR
jgi:hypothetical protein